MRLLTVIFLLFLVSGCRNFSPRIEPKIDNQNGKIGEVETMANSLKAEIGNLKTQAEIQNSRLDRIQNGLANLQQNNDNHGIQILSGPGGLVLGFLIVCIATVVYFRLNAIRNLKTANILAEKIVNAQNPKLIDSVFEAAAYTDVEDQILKLINKHEQ